MADRLRARELFDELRERLELRWLGGQRGGERVIERGEHLSRRPSLAGYLNVIHPNKVQVIGAAELAQMAGQYGVLIEPGDVFFLAPPYPCRHFRLRLSSIPAGQIAAGIRALSLATDELARARGAQRQPTAAPH